ncbi:hypothetical protein CGRA01v4_01697 [Colletotrichum graminicola]|nr:hypothetical protein CGRA01v4_01697 [Colletotrichum graminicola]
MFCHSPADSNRLLCSSWRAVRSQPAARQAATRPHPPGPLDLRHRHTFRGLWNERYDLMGWIVFSSASVMAKLGQQPSRFELRHVDTRGGMEGERGVELNRAVLVLS